MKLHKKELDKVLNLVSPRNVDYQAGRICRLLAQGENRTGVIASKCSTGNISDVVAKSINPKIAPLGLWVGCVKPPTAILNRFDQRAGDYIYSFYRAKAANDDTYEQSLEDNLLEDLKTIPKLGGG